MANPFEQAQRKVIPAVLIYAERSDGRILMIHRNSVSRPGDYHAGRWNGLGGKLELDESSLEAGLREFKEEAGVITEPDAWKSLGVLQFPNFKAQKCEDWLVYLFKLRLTDEQVQRVVHQNDEGDLHWIEPADLEGLHLWPGDRHFILHVVANTPIVGTLWYEGPNLKRVWIQKL